MNLTPTSETTSPSVVSTTAETTTAETTTAETTTAGITTPDTTTLDTTTADTTVGTTADPSINPDMYPCWTKFPDTKISSEYGVTFEDGTEIPNINGLTLAEAKRRCEILGLRI